jgi:ribosome maturation factor RimP
MDEKLSEIAGELRKQNNLETSKLEFNKKKQRMEAIAFLKDTGLSLDHVPGLLQKLSEFHKKEDPSEEGKTVQA